jgi:hypothetical protein
MIMRGIAAALAVLGVAGQPALAAAPPARLDAAEAAARTDCAIWQGRAPAMITADSPAVRRTAGVRRQGRLLMVRGQRFADVDGEQEIDRVRYFYAGRMITLPVDVVVHAPYEGQQWVLVAAGGDRASVPGMPQPSPGGRLFAAHGADPSFGQHGLVLMTLTEHGFAAVARFGRAVRPCGLRWRDDAHLELRVEAGDGSEGMPAVVEQRAGRWVLARADGQVLEAD